MTEGSKPDGRSERGKATRDRLVSAAREQFGSLGFEMASIDTVLGATEVTRGALYHHFATKEALFDAVLEQLFVEISGATASAARTEQDPAESLRAGCHAWLRLAQNPAVQRIMLTDARAVVGWQRVRELDIKHFLGGVERNLGRIAAQGRLAPVDQRLLALMLMASLTEVSLSIASEANRRAALKAGTAAVDCLLDALIRPAAAVSRKTP